MTAQENYIIEGGGVALLGMSSMETHDATEGTSAGSSNSAPSEPAVHSTQHSLASSSISSPSLLLDTDQHAAFNPSQIFVDIPPAPEGTIEGSQDSIQHHMSTFGGLVPSHSDSLFENAIENLSTAGPNAMNPPYVPDPWLSANLAVVNVDPEDVMMLETSDENVGDNPPAPQQPSLHDIPSEASLEHLRPRLRKSLVSIRYIQLT